MIQPVDLQEIQLELNKYDLQITTSYSFDQLLENLSVYINHLITNNFNLLISLLYQLDISEEKLQTLLKQNQQEQAGKLIAQLIIERQLKVIKTRKTFKGNNDIPEDEKW